MRIILPVVRLLVAGALATVLTQQTVVENLLLRHAARTVVMVWLVVEIAKIFQRLVVQNPRLKERARDSLTFGFSLIVILALLETLWMYLPRSHGVGYTYAARNWFYYFWHTNELGYRDKPVGEVDVESPKVFVLGDSFTAGHGIRSPSETYAGQLQTLTGDQVEVLNLGRNGSDTRDELARLRQFPLEPDILVMQYFANDIEVAAAGHGYDFSSSFVPYGDVNPVVKWTLLGSYLLNYAYWLFPHGDTENYAETLLRAHRDPEVTSDHFGDLAGVIGYSESREVPLVVVMFPFLANLTGSASYTDPVGAFFESRGVPVIYVADLVKELPTGSRVVNSNDAHPSTLVHRLVAERLYDLLSEQGWLTPQAGPRISPATPPIGQ